MRRACGLILPSEREGYGSVVVEAIARGIPAIVVQGSDNAATDLIVEDVNGFVAPSVEPAVLAEYMVKLYVAGSELRARTHQWYLEHASELSIDASIEQLDEAYREIVNSSKA